MTKWRVVALIAVATLVPALTVAVVLADLPRFAGTVELLGGPRVLSSLHVALFVGFVMFMFVHVYLTTLGHSAGAHIRAMVTGYEEVEGAGEAASALR